MATGYDRSRIGFHAPPTIHVLPRVPCRAQDGEMKRILRGSEAAPAAAAASFTQSSQWMGVHGDNPIPLDSRLDVAFVLIESSCH